MLVWRVFCSNENVGSEIENTATRKEINLTHCSFSFNQLKTACNRIRNMRKAPVFVKVVAQSYCLSC